jgi:hypothetical protein
LDIIPIGIALQSTPLSRVFLKNRKDSIWIQWNNFEAVSFPNMEFTYRITILKNGAISFAYNKLLISVSNGTKNKVGLFAGKEGDVLKADLTPYATYIHSKTEIVFVFTISCTAQDECVKCLNYSSKCNWDATSKTCKDRTIKEPGVHNKSRLSTICSYQEETISTTRSPSNNIITSYADFNNLNFSITQNSRNVCAEFKNCTKCMGNIKTDNVTCFWCHDSQRCHDNDDKCNKAIVKGNFSWYPKYTDILPFGLTYMDYCSYEKYLSTSSIISTNYVENVVITSIVLSIAVLIILCVWVIRYANNNPNSTLGRLSFKLTRNYTLINNSSNKISSGSELQLTTIGAAEEKE